MEEMKSRDFSIENRSPRAAREASNQLGNFRATETAIYTTQQQLNTYQSD
jgi:hypothetical protein